MGDCGNYGDQEKDQKTDRMIGLESATAQTFLGTLEHFGKIDLIKHIESFCNLFFVIYSITLNCEIFNNF